MDKFMKIILAVVMIFSLMEVSRAQKMIKISSDKDAFIFVELGAIVTLKEDMIKVDNLLPLEVRPLENREIDIQLGDALLMLNGEHIQTIDDLKRIYGGLNVNNEIKLGIKRKDKTMIIAFNKVDPDNLPTGLKIRVLNSKEDAVKMEKEILKNNKKADEK